MAACEALEEAGYASGPVRVVAADRRRYAETRVEIPDSYRMLHWRSLEMKSW